MSNLMTETKALIQDLAEISNRIRALGDDDHIVANALAYADLSRNELEDMLNILLAMGGSRAA